MNKLTNTHKTIIFVVVFLLLIIIPVSFAYGTWNNNYRDKINPGIKIGNIDLSGLTPAQAETKINAEADRLESNGIIIAYNDKQTVLPAIISANADLSFPVFTYNRDETLKQLLEASPQNSFWSYLKNSLTGAFSDHQIKAVYSFDRERAKTFILENLKEVEVEPQNASFAGKKNNNSTDLFYIEPETIGRQINFGLAFDEVEDQLQSFGSEKIILKTITARPKVHVADLESLKPEAETLIAQGDLKLKASSSTWTVKKETIASWIISEGEVGNFHVSLDLTKISDYLKEKIAPSVDQEAKTPRYTISGGKMSSWQTGSDGQKLNLETSAAQIRDQYLINKQTEAGLIIDTVKNQVTENTNNLNIEEIIGTGHSNFVGSTANRRHNIQVGAAAVNGMLIAPGEEFSLVKTLGAIDATSGYLPELVIKSNKTIPEYGGGLCQVATTIFRSALASGLPITARQNHSYRVSYYEPAGTDAAVYDPWPDIRFLNDSGGYILIQTRIVKNDIYFDFWGKKDGRIASSTTPVIYNITKPAPAKLIETTDLKPGVKKCTEKAHNGADAYFDYKVTYASGDVKSTRFKSHYVPWQEVCLIGKEADTSTSTTTPVTKATSTTPTN